MSESVGDRIRIIRKKLGLSMEEFGKLFNPKASKGVVSNWENNYNLPNNERLKRIAELGNVSMNYLLEGELSKEEGIMMEFGFFLQYQETLKELENKIEEGIATEKDIEDKDKILRRLENQRDKVLHYLLKDEIELERIFIHANNLKIGDKILNQEQKEQALKMLKALYQD